MSGWSGCQNIKNVSLQIDRKKPKQIIFDENNHFKPLTFGYFVLHRVPSIGCEVKMGVLTLVIINSMVLIVRVGVFAPIPNLAT